MHSRTGHCGRRTAFQSIVDNRATIHNPQRLCDNGTNFVHPALNSCGNEEACGLPTGNASTMWTIGKEFPPFVQARNLSREKLHTMTGMEAQHNETEAAGKPALVMTTSIPLHLFTCLPLPYHLSDKMYSITAFHCRQHLFQTFFIFLYFSYFPVFFIYKYTYFSLFIHRTCHLQLLLHILISAEPTIGKFFQMHGNSQIPAQDY